MKKFIAVILTVILAVCALPAFAEVGGWELYDVKSDIPEEALTAFNSAMEMIVGVNYEPVALLGTQVVSGTNYSFLCKAAVVIPDAEDFYAIVCVYAALDGSVSILGINALDLSCTDIVYDGDYEEYDEEMAYTEYYECYVEGDTMILTLLGNETTGYQWTYAFDEEAPIEAVSQEYVVEASDEPTCGAGGTYHFTFKGTGEGSAVIIFTYSRPWENEEPVEQFALVLDIAADGTINIID